MLMHFLGQESLSQVPVELFIQAAEDFM